MPVYFSLESPQPLKLTGPDRFELTFSPTQYRVQHPGGGRTFTRPASTTWPKLYVFVSETAPVYVGITRRPLSSRLRDGWNADGSSGYYGYAMRHHLRAASMFVWYADEDRGDESTRFLETVEAEVAFLIRQAGQWPRFQTEIHFYPSEPLHRNHARRIVDEIAGAL